MATDQNPIVRMQRTWQRLQRVPGGAWLFSRVLGWFNPYSGSIGARVLELKPGFARFELRDRRRIRNHLNSIHALALANLGEFTSGMAMLTGLPPGVRGIPVHLSIEFYKKARGSLLAESHCDLPEVTEDMEYEIHTDIRDSDNDVVAHTNVRWRLGLIPEKS